MKTLMRGQKLPLSDLTNSPILRVALAAATAAPGLKLDFACFGVNAEGKLADERYFIFYNQKSSDGLELNSENKKTQQYKVPDGELAAAILSTALNF